MQKIHAQKSEELFNEVAIRSSEINMKVNSKKTQLLCITANTTSDTYSYIRTGNEKIISTNSLKILGFMFGNSPNVNAHISLFVCFGCLERGPFRCIRHTRKGKGRGPLYEVPVSHPPSKAGIHPLLY